MEGELWGRARCWRGKEAAGGMSGRKGGREGRREMGLRKENSLALYSEVLLCDFLSFRSK